MKVQPVYDLLAYGVFASQSSAANESRFDQRVSARMDTAACSTVRLNPDSINDPILEFKRALPDTKPRAAKRLRAFVSLDSSEPRDVARRVKTVVKSILDSDYSERTSDATYFLAYMQVPMLKTLVDETKVESPSEESKDFWSCVVRALGQLKQLDMVLPFTGSNIVGIRVAVAEALADINSEPARRRLVKMQTQDKSHFVREVAADLLLD